MNADQTTNATSDVHAQDNSTATAQTYVLNDADRRVLAITSGRHGQWFEKGSDGQSFSDIFGGLWLERISARTTAWALLAAAEYTLKKFVNGEKFHEPVLVALARSGYIEMALAVIRADEQLVFLDRSQRTFVKKDDFDHCVNVGNTEAHTALKDCSLWTLCKHLHAQVCAGVNLCFERNLRDLPIRPDAPAKVTKAKGNGGQSNERAPREKPTSRSAEDATWNGLATADFSVAIDEISAAYNRMLAGSPDFSDAYKALGHARHVHFSQLSAQRKAEFEKKREERQTNRAQNPKEVRPKKDVRSKKNGEIAPKATPSEQGAETQAAVPARAPAPPTASAPAVNVWAVRKTETRARARTEAEAEAEAQDTEQTEPVEGESKSAEKTVQKGANSRVRVRREKPATNTDADGFTLVRSKAKAKAKAHATSQPRGKGKYQGRKPVSAPLSSDTA